LAYQYDKDMVNINRLERWLMMHCYDISGKYWITAGRELSGPPGYPDCRGTNLFVSETRQVRLAMTTNVTGYCGCKTT